MRILFSTTAGDGHFGPLIPVARACVAAGHEVRVAAPASFANHVTRAGLDFTPFDDAPAELLGAIFGGLPGKPPEEANRIVVREVFAGLDAQHALPGARAIVEDWRPELVVREPVEFGSLAAALAADVPHAVVSIGLTRFADTMYGLVDEPLAELDERAGLEPGACSAALAAAPLLTAVPPSFDEASLGVTTWMDDAPAAPDRRVWRYREGVRPDDAGLPEPWGDPDHPLVYVTFGTVAAGLGPFGPVFRQALDELADGPYRVLLTTGHAFDLSTLGPVPPNAHVEPFRPQDSILRHAAAMVGHGGFGTTMGALSRGVPQVVVPLFASDQFFNAATVDRLGAGLRLSDEPAALDGLDGAVQRVLTEDGYRGTAARVADEIGSLPDVSEMVEILEGIAARA